MFAENLSDFLADFGVAAVYGGVTYQVLFDTPGSDLLGARVSDVQYEMLYVTAQMPSLEYGNLITIAGKIYTVLNTNGIDDGGFSKAILESNT